DPPVPALKVVLLSRIPPRPASPHTMSASDDPEGHGISRSIPATVLRLMDDPPAPPLAVYVVPLIVTSVSPPLLPEFSDTPVPPAPTVTVPPVTAPPPSIHFSK